MLKSFKIIIVAPKCFGLHKPSSGNSQPVLRQSYNVDIGYICRYLKLSLLWLHIAATVTITSNNGVCSRYKYCNLAKHRLRAP